MGRELLEELDVNCGAGAAACEEDEEWCIGEANGPSDRGPEGVRL